MDLPDPLYRRLKLQAAREGKTLWELVIRYLEEGRGAEAGRVSWASAPTAGPRGRAAHPRSHPRGALGPSGVKRVDLLDLNVWFALLVPERPFHPRARA